LQCEGVDWSLHKFLRKNFSGDMETDERPNKTNAVWWRGLESTQVPEERTWWWTFEITLIRLRLYWRMADFLTRSAIDSFPWRSQINHRSVRNSIVAVWGRSEEFN
jgi:hypothetical protein